MILGNSYALLEHSFSKPSDRCRRLSFVRCWPTFNPVLLQKNATPKQTILVSRCAVVAFGVLMGILAVVLNVAGVSLGWVYLAMCVPSPPHPPLPPPSHPPTQHVHTSTRLKVHCAFVHERLATSYRCGVCGVALLLIRYH